MQNRTPTVAPRSALAAMIVFVIFSGVTDGAADDTFTYIFNAADQLTEVKLGSETIAEFTYDGDGLRIKKTTPSGTIIYIRDDTGNVLAEYDGSGNLLAEYTD